ncbi:sulfatase [Candidatus Epulonipiscium viviparus]|uniref:sulfatase family protein n=1 Tax=Candidatus Epulonipiscium viviparus TaxID=420336 RepID=UPI0027380CFD|nr:sulfatase-like hydrolase/transferase [Candidatus Epulopiscium viviparus]
MKKNVVVILCDQLRTDFLSCYGSDFIKTPNIDQLAADGVLFERATTVSPVCGPGRACMMTGQYVSGTGVWTNDVPFKAGLEYIPERMNQNGYVTGAFGKLHHMPSKDVKGFAVACQMEEGRLAADDDFYKFLKRRHPEINTISPQKDGRFAFGLEDYYEEWIANNAVKFIEDHKDEPLFAWVSFQGPHQPYDAPAENGISTVLTPPDPIMLDFEPSCNVPKYRRASNISTPSILGMKAYRERRARYAEGVQIIDYEVGKIIAKLKELGIYKDTVIIFSTDHGCMLGDYDMYEKGAMPYKAQLEIPMIVVDADALPQGKRSDMLVSNLDIAGTALKAAEDPKPLGYSRSIVEMYNNCEIQRSVIFTEFCDSMKLVSTKKYRLAYYPFSKEHELFAIDDETTDLTLDPELQELRIELLSDIIDFVVMAKGEVYLEGHDTVPAVQVGLDEKYYNYREVAPLATPIWSERSRQSLRDHGLDADYTEFMKAREDEFVVHYGKYWRPGDSFFKKTY